MRFHRLAIVTTTVALLVGLAPAAQAVPPEPDRRPAASVARGDSHGHSHDHARATGGKPVVHRDDHAHLRKPGVTLRELYRDAGLQTRRQKRLARTSGTATPRMATAQAAATDGGALLPWLSRHVDQVCPGTGADGARVQLAYVRETDQPDRYTQSAPLIRNEAKVMDDTLAVSAKQTNGGRRWRWVTGSDCQISVLNVVLPDGAITGGFNSTVTAMQNAGHNLTDRKYVLFADMPMGGLGGSACGMGQIYHDTATAGNNNDGKYAQYARIDLDCWVATAETGSVALHELMHTVGAVNPDTPHGTNGAHCTDDYDLMCYPDGSGEPMQQTCPQGEEPLLDCGKDDYFHTNPAAGSYLATHWNTAASRFMQPVTPLGNPPSLSVTRPGSGSVPAGDPTTFTATVPTGATVTWQVDITECDPDGDGVGTGTTFTIRCWNVATPTVTAIASTTSTPMATRVSDSVTYAAVPAPEMTFTRPASVQVNTQFQVTANITGKGTWQNQWDLYTNPGCSIVSGQNTFTATLTCTDTAAGKAVGVRATATRVEDGQVLINSTGVQIATDTSTPTVTITGPTSVIAGSTATFTAQVSNATSPTYLWSSTNGWATTGATGTTFTVRAPSNAGGSQDAIWLTVTGANGRKTTTSMLLTVAEPLAVTLSVPTKMDAGAAYTVTAEPNRAASLTWSLNNSDCTIAPSAGTTARMACPSGYDGSVQVTVKATANGETATKSKWTYVAPVQQDTRLTIKTTTGYPTRVVATLTDYDTGAAVAGQPVQIEGRTGNGDYQVLHTATTDANGRISFSHPTTEPTTFRAQYLGTAGIAEAVSPERRVSVYTTLLHQKVRKGLKVMLRTGWGGKVASRPVILESRRAGARRWEPVRQVALNSLGIAVVKINPSRTTAYRWRFRGDLTYRASISKSVTLR